MTDTMKPDIDWEAIEREYRAGQLSIREIGRTFEISYEAIRKHAKVNGWQRDLADKVRASVKDKVLRDIALEVDGRVDGTVDTANARDINTETVEAAGLRGADIERQQRGALGRARAVTTKLLDELEVATVNRAEIVAAIGEATKADRGGKRRAMMLRAVELPSRAGVAASLSVALRNLITLERRAYRLDDPSDGQEKATSLTELRRQLSGNALRPVE